MLQVLSRVWFVLSVVLSSLGSSNHLKRPYKLEVHTEHKASSSSLSGGLHCTFLALHTTQIHKDLLSGTDQLVSTSGKLIHGENVGQEEDGEFMHYFSYNSDLLWEKAISLCGSSLLWSFPVYVAPELELSESLFVHHDDASQRPLTSKAFWNTLPPVPQLEILPIIMTGKSSNRVDFVFFSDGYTQEERDKFLKDARTLAFDISNNQTFASVKLLLNFWAAFTPSNESGIGVGGEVKDTPFGLYRDGTELRAVYYAKPEVAHALCLYLGDLCDYPILLGNDPLYGGLGGRFTVTTSSEINGALVLRHELGHSVIGEGEEYDGGYAYYGPNAANITQPFKWARWLTEQSSVPREERSVMPIQAYPWTMLNVSDSWNVSFKSSGLYARHVVRFSLSGLPQKEDLTIRLDGEELRWRPRAGVGLDRWHYDIHRNISLQENNHELSFKLENAVLEGQAQLCSVEVIEYGDNDEFNGTTGFIGAFPTWSDKNTTTYRPTNEGCLMRIVTTPDFCEVCIEGLWHALLKRVDLIDDITLGCVLDASSLSLYRAIEVHLIRLVESTSHSGSYAVNWKKNGVDMPDMANQTSITVDNESAVYSVQVQFATDEVRVDPYGYLLSTVAMDVPKCEAESAGHTG